MKGDFGAKIRNITKTWKGRHNLPSSQHPKDYEEFDQALDEVVNSIIEEIKQHAWVTAERGLQTQEEFVAELNQRTNRVLMNNNTHKLHYIKSSFHWFCTNYKDLSDEITQEVKHDYGSKRRFLLFRIFTTLGIAGAALGMAMFANFIGYETAILKKIDEKPKTELVIDLPESKIKKNDHQVGTRRKSRL